MSFLFSFSSVALSWCYVFSRFSTRFNNKKKDTERDTRHLSTHLYVPQSSRHPLSDLATQPIRLATLAPIDLWFCTFCQTRPAAFGKTGPLAPCATEPLTGDLDCVGSLISLFLMLPLWAACFVYLFRQCVFPICFGCVIRVVYGIWLCVWTHVRVRE